VLYAPVSGRVVEVFVQAGAVAQTGRPLLRILRDPYPNPDLALSEAFFKPATEELHHTLLELRKAIKLREVTKLEIERVEKFVTGGNEAAPLINKKTIVDLRYDLAKSEQEVAALEQELGRHGLTATEVADIEAGKSAPPAGKEIWKKALEQNGLWNESGAKLLDALPATMRDLPWTIAAVAELFASGRINPEIAEWISKTPDATKHFLEIAGMLQRGHTLDDLKALVAAQGFEPIVEIVVAGAGQPEDWDVETLSARQDQRVEKGTELMVLENHRRVLLRAEPQGSEMPLVVSALQKQTSFHAVPLVANAGPTLKDLTILSLEGNEKGNGVAALIPAGNSEEARRKGFGGEVRTWTLRAGQRFLVRIPVEEFKDVFVLPTDAVTDDGADKIVLIQNGDSFEPKKVVILYQDSEETVIDGKSSELFPGDTVVQHGAFGLSLALKGGGGEPAGEEGGEAGHHHHHHHH
jgi:multidrug efflux pump subunit AcrA (membrane-fusion protein)